MYISHSIAKTAKLTLTVSQVCPASFRNHEVSRQPGPRVQSSGSAMSAHSFFWSSDPLVTLPNLTNHIITRNGSYPQPGAFGNVRQCVWRSDLSTELEVWDISVNTYEIRSWFLRQVAVKTIQVPRERRKEIVSIFVTIASNLLIVSQVHHDLFIWGRLNHENIVRLFGVASGFGDPATSISMVSVWFPNGTLTTFLSSQHDTFNHRQRLGLVSIVPVKMTRINTYYLSQAPRYCSWRALLCGYACSHAV